MKKKKIFIALVSIAAIAALGGTYAAFVSSSDPVRKTVSASSLGIEIEQSEWKADPGQAEAVENGVVFSGGVPGEEITGNVTVRNTEDQDAYIRVAVYRSWLDDGEKVADGSLDVEEIEYGWKDAGTAGEWIVLTDEEDPEITYFYYKYPVGSGESTETVMDYFSVLKKTIHQNQNQYADKGVKLEFEADGIQTIAAKDAMLAEWGVVAQIDADGVLTSVTEQ